MEQTTKLRLAWRQEFATALLNELEVYCSPPPEDIIVDFCLIHIKASETIMYNMKTLELSLMGYIVKRKLKNRGLIVTINYLEMLEDCFTDCKMCLN